MGHNGQPGARAGEERSAPGKILAAEKCIYWSGVNDLISVKAQVQLCKGGAFSAGWGKTDYFKTPEWFTQHLCDSHMNSMPQFIQKYPQTLN